MQTFNGFPRPLPDTGGIELPSPFKAGTYILETFGTAVCNGESIWRLLHDFRVYGNGVIRIKIDIATGTGSAYNHTKLLRNGVDIPGTDVVGSSERDITVERGDLIELYGSRQTTGSFTLNWATVGINFDELVTLVDNAVVPV